MDGKPATIRYLDPPLHEFLPQTRAEKDDLAAKLGVSSDRVQQICHSLHESNPMLGHRGCRLGMVYPEITEMQTRALIKAAIKVGKAGKVKKPQPEIMIPLVGFARELELQLEIVHRVAKEEIAKELGDVLWYVANLSFELGYDLGDIAALNIQKLVDRQERGKIQGDGDNR